MRIGICIVRLPQRLRPHWRSFQRPGLIYLPSNLTLGTSDGLIVAWRWNNPELTHCFILCQLLIYNVATTLSWIRTLFSDLLYGLVPVWKFDAQKSQRILWNRHLYLYWSYSSYNCPCITGTNFLAILVISNLGSFTLHVQLGLGWDVFQNGWDGSQPLRHFVSPPSPPPPLTYFLHIKLSVPKRKKSHILPGFFWKTSLRDVKFQTYGRTYMCI